jgi:hypothetical protein
MPFLVTGERTQNLSGLLFTAESPKCFHSSLLMRVDRTILSSLESGIAHKSLRK